MSDLEKEENNDNPIKISEILADFFLKKMGTSHVSDNSENLHKRKKKKSKHKRKKYKKSKHRHRSRSESKSELDIKGVDDVSSSEEMGIKRLKKLKTFKLQSTTNVSSPSVINKTNIQPTFSLSEKPIFYGPSLELLLSGVNHNLKVDSDPNIPPKDSDNKQMSENETEKDLKETVSSIQEENQIKNFAQNSEQSKSSIVSLESSNLNCDNINKENSTHCDVISDASSDFKNIQENSLNSDVNKNSSESFLEEQKSEISLNLNDCKIAVKKNELQPDKNKSASKTCIETEDSEISINKVCLEEKKFVNVVGKKECDESSKENYLGKTSVNECKSIISNSCNYLPTNIEANKGESSENCMKSNFTSDEKIESHNNHKKDNEIIITSDINPKKDENSHFDNKPKKIKKSKSKHSKSQSPTNCSSSKSKHNKHRSRSLSQDSYHSKKRNRKQSRSRSHSHEEKRFNVKRGRSYTRSYSRSRSRHRRSKKSHSYSPSRKSRKCSRSRSYINSKDSYRLKTHKHDGSKKHHYSSSKYSKKSRSRRSSSRSKSRSKSKSRHKSVSPKNSHSRHKPKKKNSSEKSNRIDQAKILETARRNVLQMIEKGTLPKGLPINSLKKEQLLSIQAGGKSVQELTDFCQRLSQKENEPDSSDSEGKDDKADDETCFIHHPFKIREHSVIKLNIKNAVQLPIKTHAQKVAETARLSSQFPVSSGNKHRQKELEWIPVVPESSKTDTKSNVTAISTSSAIVPPLPVEKTVLPISATSPPPPPPSVPIVYPCPPPTEIVPASTPMDVPSIFSSTTSLISIPSSPTPLPSSASVIQSTAIYQMPSQPMIVSYAMPNQEMSLSSVSPLISSSSVFKPPKRLDISSIVTKRFQALQKLNENPNDFEALRMLQEAEGSIQDWVESQQVPGLFTGSTDVKVLSATELCGPFKYQNQKKVKFFALLEIILVE